jgi:hypothetical protein
MFKLAYRYLIEPVAPAVIQLGCMALGLVLLVAFSAGGIWLLRLLLSLIEPAAGFNPRHDGTHLVLAFGVLVAAMAVSVKINSAVHGYLIKRLPDLDDHGDVTYTTTRDSRVLDRRGR